MAPKFLLLYLENARILASLKMDLFMERILKTLVEVEKKVVCGLYENLKLHFQAFNKPNRRKPDIWVYLRTKNKGSAGDICLSLRSI